jgi:hypothetical protein
MAQTERPDSPATIFEEWQSYDRDVVPVTAPDIQREECRRAFYAGAWACFCAVLAATEPDNEDECERRLQAIQDEIQNIPKDLRL